MSELEWQYEQFKAAMEAGDWPAARVRAETIARQLRQKTADRGSCEFCPHSGGGCIVCN